jgi:hypothetical protein
MVWSTTANSSAESIPGRLLAQPGAERLDRVGGVVAEPVQAMVYGLVDAAGGLERGRHRQGGGRHYQAGVLWQQLAQADD